MQKKIVKKALSYLLTAVIIVGSINLSPLGMVEVRADETMTIIIGGETISISSSDAPKYAKVTGGTVTTEGASDEDYNIKIEYVNDWPDSYFKLTLDEMHYTGEISNYSGVNSAMYVVFGRGGIINIVGDNSILGGGSNQDEGIHIETLYDCTFTGSGTLTVGDTNHHYETGLCVESASMTRMKHATLHFNGSTSYGMLIKNGGLSVESGSIVAKGPNGVKIAENDCPLSISGGKLTADCSSYKVNTSTPALYVQSDLTVSDGELEAYAPGFEYAVDSDIVNWGIYVPALKGKSLDFQSICSRLMIFKISTYC